MRKSIVEIRKGGYEPPLHPQNMGVLRRFATLPDILDLYLLGKSGNIK